MHARLLLPAINNALEVEDNDAWKADGLLDKAKALLALNRLDEAFQVVEECQLLHPQGRVNAGIRTIKGDIYMKRNNATEAANEYVAVVQFLSDDDRMFKPELLWKLEQALKKEGKTGEAEKYRLEREKKYPDWKPGGN